MPGVGSGAGEGCGLAGIAPGVGIGGTVTVGSTGSEHPAARRTITASVRTDLTSTTSGRLIPLEKVREGGDSGSSAPLRRCPERPHDGCVAMEIRRARRDPAAEVAEQRVALTALLRSARFELIPLRDALERAEALPPGAATTVTASPSHGIEATIDLCEGLTRRGHDATPHLAAHMFRDRTHLADVLDRGRDVGLRSAFVIGGDAKDRGELHDGIALLRAMDELGHPFTSIGVAGYPEGHPAIPEERLMTALLEKQAYATSVTTQMTFDGEAIAAWIRGSAPPA